MVRVTLLSETQHIQQLIANSFSTMSKTEDQLSTGKQLLQPSDDPAGVENDLRVRTAGSVLSQDGKNITDGLNFMQISDTAMNSMNTVMQRLRELALQASSDTLGASDRQSIQQEQDQLFRQMISLANTNYEGNYVFGGTQSKIAPFPIDSSVASGPADYQKLNMAYFNGAAAGVGQPTQIRNAFDNSAETNILPGSLKLSDGANQFVEGKDYTVDYVNGTITPINPALAVDLSDGGTFAGPNYQPGAFSLTFDRVGQAKDVYGNAVANTGNILREIEPGVTTPINIAGNDLVVNNATGTNLITSMITFGQNLIQNNQAGISSAITDIDNSSQQILNAQSKNGARMNMLQTTQSRNADQVTQNTSLQSDLEDVDMGKAATDFSLQQTVYQAALKSAADVIQPTLTNYL
jgi:flagellar hook-associated protein 3 FlgL